MHACQRQPLGTLPEVPGLQVLGSHEMEPPVRVLVATAHSRDVGLGHELRVEEGWVVERNAGFRYQNEHRVSGGLLALLAAAGGALRLAMAGRTRLVFCMHELQ